jgi:hypothetical protein
MQREPKAGAHTALQIEVGHFGQRDERRPEVRGGPQAIKADGEGAMTANSPGVRHLVEDCVHSFSFVFPVVLDETGFLLLRDTVDEAHGGLPMRDCLWRDSGSVQQQGGSHGRRWQYR